MKRVVLLLTGWFLFGVFPALADQGSRILPYFPKEDFERLLEKHKFQIVSHLGTMDNLSVRQRSDLEKKKAEQQKKPGERSVKEPVRARENGVTLIHLVWIGKDENLLILYLERPTGYSVSQGIIGIIPRHQNPDGSIEVDPGAVHEHGGRFFRPYLYGTMQAPIDFQDLQYVFGFSEAELLELQPPTLWQRASQALLPTTGFGTGLLLWFSLRRYRRKVRMKPVLRPVYQPVLISRTPRKKREPLPIYIPPPTLINPALSEAEKEECAGIISELKALSSLVEDEAKEMIYGLIDRLYDLPDNLRKLKRARHYVEDAREIVWAAFETPEGTTLDEDDEENASVDSSGRQINPREELLIDQYLPTDVDLLCAKAVIVKLLRLGAAVPYSGMHRTAAELFIQHLTHAGFDRVTVERTIRALIRIGVIKYKPRSGRSFACYSLEPHPDEIDGVGREILKAAFGLWGKYHSVQRKVS